MGRAPQRCRELCWKCIPVALFTGFILSVGGLLLGAGSRSALPAVVAVIAMVATVGGLLAWVLNVDRGAHAPISWSRFEREFWSFVESTSNE